MSQANVPRLSIVNLLCALDIVDSLSQYKEMVGIGCGHNFISYNKFFSHSASLPTAANAINLNSIVECEIQVCFLEAHETAPPPRVKTQPDVALLSLALVIQLASV